MNATLRGGIRAFLGSSVHRSPHPELGFETLAEGIETQDELEVCMDLGLRAAQGYLLGRPKPIDEFEATDALWTPDFRLFND